MRFVRRLSAILILAAAAGFGAESGFAGICDKAEDALKFLADCQGKGTDPVECMRLLSAACGGPESIWCVPDSGSAQPGFRIGCVFKCKNGVLIEPTVCLGTSTDSHDPTNRIEVGIRPSPKHNYTEMCDIVDGKIVCGDKAGCKSCHFDGFTGSVDHGTGGFPVLTPGADDKDVFIDKKACEMFQDKWNKECKGKSPKSNACVDLEAMLEICKKVTK